MYVKEIKRLDDGRPYAIEIRDEDDTMKVNMKWDGCIDLRRYWNGDTADNNSGDNTDYIHICEVKEFIKKLQSVVDIAKQNFHEDDFNNYWSDL